MPAVLQTPVGAGSATQFAWQPGVSYLINASEYTTIPNPRTQLQSAVRELIVGLTRGAFTPPVRLALPGREVGGVIGMETPLLTSSRGAVVALLNWGGDAALGAVVQVQVDLPAAVFGSPPHVGRVFSARTGANLTSVARERQTVSVEVRAAYTDFIVFIP